MKQNLILLLFALFIFGSLTAQSSTAQPTLRSLVLYFSVPETDDVDASTGASRLVNDGQLYGTTEYVATLIADATKGKLIELKTKRPYPTQTHKALIDFAKKESEEQYHPELATTIPNLENYDVIYIGYPNWWYDMPMVIYTLMNQYDFSGKTIVPFCTHGGSGFSDSVKHIQDLAPKATVKAIPAISRGQAAQSKKALTIWLNQNKFI